MFMPHLQLLVDAMAYGIFSIDFGMLECWNRSIVMSLASWNHTTADPPSGMVSVCGDQCIHLLGEGPGDTWNTDEHSDITYIYKHYPLV